MIETMILLRRHVHGGHCVRHRAPFDQLPRNQIADDQLVVNEKKGSEERPVASDDEGTVSNKRNNSTGRLTDRDRIEREREKEMIFVRVAGFSRCAYTRICNDDELSSHTVDLSAPCDITVTSP